MDRYDAEIRDADEGVGRLIREARKRLHRPLIIVVSADHGEEFHDHGGVYHGSSVYQEQIRVPLIMYIPGVRPRRVQAPVSLIDLAPTLLGLVGGPVPDTMQGTDLRALAVGRVHDIGPAYAGVGEKRMVVRWPYKLIADLRFNLFEIYDLEHDPHERTNLAASHPKLLDSLRGELYAWLDSLQRTPDGQSPGDPRTVAIERGRVGDTRAVGPLSKLVVDESAPHDMRAEAAHILGKLADDAAKPALVRAMRSSAPRVSAEAAIALGHLGEGRAKGPLRRLVYSEDPDMRVRAAVALGRLGDRAAVPGLIDGLWIADEEELREAAVRELGWLRDTRAVEPLINLIPELRLRYLTVVALGDIGDTRALAPLLEMLDWEHHSNVRDNIVRALGQIGDPRALPSIVDIAATEPDMKNAGESLERLHALSAGAIGGTDVGPHASVRGFGTCHQGPSHDNWAYRQRTWCAGTRDELDLHLRVPAAVRDAPGGAVALLRARRIDSGPATEVHVTVAGQALSPVRIDGHWTDFRWDVPHAALSSGSAAQAVITTPDSTARLAVDHLLLIPQPPIVAGRLPAVGPT